MCNYIIGSRVSEGNGSIINVQSIKETNASKAVSIYEREYLTDGELILIGEKRHGCITIDPDVAQYAMKNIIGNYFDIDDYVVVAPIIMSKKNK